MLISRPSFPLILTIAIALLFLGGCTPSLNSPEYGEIITAVPKSLDREFPLPELDSPPESPLRGPESTASESASPADEQEQTPPSTESADPASE